MKSLTQHISENLITEPTINIKIKQLNKIADNSFYEVLHNYFNIDLSNSEIDKAFENKIIKFNYQKNSGYYICNDLVINKKNISFSMSNRLEVDNYHLNYLIEKGIIEITSDKPSVIDLKESKFSVLDAINLAKKTSTFKKDCGGLIATSNTSYWKKGDLVEIYHQRGSLGDLYQIHNLTSGEHHKAWDADDLYSTLKSVPNKLKKGIKVVIGTTKSYDGRIIPRVEEISNIRVSDGSLFITGNYSGGWRALQVDCYLSEYEKAYEKLSK